MNENESSHEAGIAETVNGSLEENGYPRMMDSTPISPKNMPPTHLRCVMGQCPSIHRLEDGRLLLVGEMLGASKWPAGLAVGIEEMPVIIPPELLDTLKAEWLQDLPNTPSPGMPPQPPSPDLDRRWAARDVFFSLIHSIRIPVPAIADPAYVAARVLRIHAGLMIEAEKHGIIAPLLSNKE